MGEVAAHLAPESDPLAQLLQLGQRARSAVDSAELEFILVNETHRLISYRQAALWLPKRGIQAISGVATPEANAPFVQWLDRLVRYFPSTVEPLRIEQLSTVDAAEWEEWLPPYGVWLPLPPLQRFSGGGLLLAREEPWLESELVLLREWAAMGSHAAAVLAAATPFCRLWWYLSGSRSPNTPIRKGSTTRWLRLTFWIVLLGALLTLKIDLTILAPADLVPIAPAVMRAPLDGIVDQVAVIPNQRVAVGDRLFEFDRTTIQSRLQVAQQALEITQAEYRQKAQQALYDVTSKVQLAVLQGQIAEKEAEMASLRQIYDRMTVVAPREGIVLFDDPTEWIGRPVVTGERVMVVADEQAVEIEAWLAPNDAIPLAEDAPVRLYLNADPLHPVAAALRYVAHEAVARPDGQYAYRARARLIAADPTLPLRVGLKGTAKISGQPVSLAYWIARRPWAALRAGLGL